MAKIGKTALIWILLRGGPNGYNGLWQSASLNDNFSSRLMYFVCEKPLLK